MAENNDMTPPEGEQPERDDAFNEMLSVPSRMLRLKPRRGI